LGQFGKNRPILTVVRMKSVAEIELRAYDRFQLNFSHFGGKQNYCMKEITAFHSKEPRHQFLVSIIPLLSSLSENYPLSMHAKTVQHLITRQQLSNDEWIKITRYESEM
jgi:hypothetical protein